jgi:hypothetical protein
MSIEVIPINTTKDKFFLEYLTLKRPVINVILTKINKRHTVLHDAPMYVLAELLWLHNEYSDLEENEKWSMIFSKNSKAKIRKKLKMPDHHLNVYFSQLRKMKILNGKKINKLFIINATDHDLSFKFVLNGQQMDKKGNT